ncbi:MAG: HPF/RaiA family ribosome-associated protein, partial [Bradymonadaceae bacterium]|nr:HPF/RaiA family ribosome-associated protein [Lujinxingiaceae bacterium]
LQYRVRIDMSVPGEELVVSRDPGSSQAHNDLYIAIRDAFNAAERQLRSYSGKLREPRKHHEIEPHAVVLRMFPHEGYGFLMTPDGREVYFHENSVLNNGFGELNAGDEVRFSEVLGDDGPQASTVDAVGRHGKHIFPG